MMIENQPCTQVVREDLPKIAAQMKAEGQRLVLITCTSGHEAFELTYTFDLNYQFKNLRCFVPRQDAVVPSITGSYLAAFAYENELQDLFGFKVTDLAVDYKGKFYRLKAKTPFAEPYTSTVKPAPASAPAAPPSEPGK
jgi:Ni,Fe-hydrogenase III component G